MYHEHYSDQTGDVDMVDYDHPYDQTGDVDMTDYDHPYDGADDAFQQRPPSDGTIYDNVYNQ
jgi:hypothetical protein